MIRLPQEVEQDLEHSWRAMKKLIEEADVVVEELVRDLIKKLVNSFNTS